MLIPFPLTHGGPVPMLESLMNTLSKHGHIDTSR